MLIKLRQKIATKMFTHSTEKGKKKKKKKRFYQKIKFGQKRFELNEEQRFKRT